MDERFYSLHMTIGRSLWLFMEPGRSILLDGLANENNQ